MVTLGRLMALDRFGAEHFDVAALRFVIDRDARSQRVQNAIKAGERLIEIKRWVGHGHWERWVKDNLPYSISKAKMYIGLARLSEADRQRVVDLAAREAQKELARIHRSESNPQPPRQTPKLQPPYSTLVDACIRLAGADVVLRYVREKRDPCDLDIPTAKFEQAARAVQRRLEAET